MQDPQTIETPPDWATTEKDLHCPLCEYNLRGLTEPRCPECGFKFQWQELIEAEKERHKYLYEYGRDRGFTSFWKTYWRTSFPRQFWNDVNPTLPVRPVHVISYWLLSGSIAAVASLATANRFFRFAWFTWSRVPSSLYIYADIFLRYTETQICCLAIFLIWPILTLIALLIFRYSMRQAKIRMVHLLRTVIYSGDFGLLLSIGFSVLHFSDLRLPSGWFILLMAILCSVVTTYRLTIAFRQYLRVHLPFATVLASQLIAFLVVFLVLIQLVDFSRRI